MVTVSGARAEWRTVKDPYKRSETGPPDSRFVMLLALVPGTYVEDTTQLQQTR